MTLPDAPVLVAQQQKTSAIQQRHHEMAMGIFDNDWTKSMSWKELVVALTPVAGNEKNAENRINAMKKYGAIRYEFGRYRLATPNPNQPQNGP